MVSAVRLGVFLLISVIIHWLVSQLAFSRQAEFSATENHSVSFVSRSAEQFLASPVIKETVRQVSPTKAPRNAQQKPESVEVAKKSTTTSPTNKVSVKDVTPIKESVLITPVPRMVSVEELPRETTEPVPEEQAVSAPVSDFSSSEIKPVEFQGKVTQTSFVDGTNAETTVPSRVESAVGQEASDTKAYQKALPRYELNPPPEYPEISWRRGHQGTVQLEVLVLVDGSVGDVEIASTSGYKRLDRAALKAVRYWQFSAAMSFGEKVDSRVVVPVDFILE